jgi:hypothetical protein
LGPIGVALAVRGDAVHDVRIVRGGLRRLPPGTNELVRTLRVEETCTETETTRSSSA